MGCSQQHAAGKQRKSSCNPAQHQAWSSCRPSLTLLAESDAAWLPTSTQRMLLATINRYRAVAERPEVRGLNVLAGGIARWQTEFLHMSQRVLPKMGHWASFHLLLLFACYCCWQTERPFYVAALLSPMADMYYGESAALH